ncbi:MAG: hypothetical protein ABJF01_14755 [bacterium]
MPEFRDPIALFRAAVDAINAENWNDAAALIDPVSLHAFHRQLDARIVPGDRVVAVTVEEYLAHSPDTPRSVAEYFVEQSRTQSDPSRRLHDHLPSVPTLDAFHSLTPAQTFSAWLDGRSLRRQVERLVSDGHVSAEIAQHRSSIGFNDYRYVALGVVPDGDQVVHVLYRREFDTSQMLVDRAATWLASLPLDEQALARDLWDALLQTSSPAGVSQMTPGF